jgi:hypothetical protein
MKTNIVVTNAPQAASRPVPLGLSIVACLGVLWNAYGVLQFSRSVATTGADLVAMGLTQAQAQAMTSYPAWMTLAFAVGTFGGVLGSVLLFARRKSAVPVFAASLAGYVVLYVGDITQGVFAAMGLAQVAVLSLVVAIACGLLWASRHADKRDALA